MEVKLSLWLLLITIDTASAFVPSHFQASCRRSALDYSNANKFIPANDWRRNYKFLPLKANNENISNEMDEKTKEETDVALYMPQMEREVLASATAKVDTNRVKSALSPDNDDFAVRYEVMSPTQPSQFSVALASGFTTALFSFLLFYQPILSASLFFIVTYIATRDPLDDQDGLVPGDTVSGPISRIVGRATLSTIEKSKPKVKAVARAAVFGDEEIQVLRKRIQDLRAENERLRTWIERRNAIDENARFYKVDELRNMAKQEGISPKGKKAELMMRLIEAGVLKF